MVNASLGNFFVCGGEGGSRTHGTLAGTLDFESSPIGHSGTSPDAYDYRY